MSTFRSSFASFKASKTIATRLFFCLAFEGINPGNKAIAVPKRGSSFRYESGSRVEFYCAKNSSGLQLTKIVFILARGIPRTEPYLKAVEIELSENEMILRKFFKNGDIFLLQMRIYIHADRMCINWIQVDERRFERFTTNRVIISKAYIITHVHGILHQIFRYFMCDFKSKPTHWF